MDKVKFNPFSEILEEDFNRQAKYVNDGVSLFINDFLTGDKSVVLGLNVKAQAVADMTVYVAPGRLYQVGKQGQLAANSNPPLAITAAHPNYDRIDRICARYAEVDDEPETRNVMVDTFSRQVMQKTVMTRTASTVEFMVVNGTAAPTPVAPTVPNGWVSLAKVNVNHGTTSVEQISIIDERPTISAYLKHMHTGGGDGTRIQYKDINGAPDLSEHNTNKDAHASGIAGNAATATKLQTARKINGVAFDGTTDINIVADGGNADTVDGKHATDFMRYMGYFSNAMFKDAEPNTVYTVGGATTDMPAGAYNYGCLETTGTSKKMVQRYTTHGIDGSSTGQFASWYRVSYGGDYSAWKKIATITDNVASATKLQTARSITVGNATKNFDGSANVGFSLAEMGISASAMGGIVAQSLGETGWVKFANGLIMQWGTVSANFTADNETKTITLPISFTSQHLFCSISETVGYAVGNTIVGVDIYSKSNENFIVKYCWDKAGEITIRFFCIGV